MRRPRDEAHSRIELASPPRPLYLLPMSSDQTAAGDDKANSNPETLSPSAFMRSLRPELYSDSTDKASYRLESPVLEYQLDTITSRNQHQAFELFCRKLCERTICPNLRPQTGPEGGGDGKVDSETYPVADELSLFFIGEPSAGRERWAFAFSAKEKWKEKIRSDVSGIIDTGRQYDRIICVTSRAAKSKDRLDLEEELKNKYNVKVTIHDRNWIAKEIIENDRKDIAFNYLGVGEAKNDPFNLGPTDYSRAKQLRDIEAALDDPQAFAGMGTQSASEALIAAKLSRNLEKPRIETDGRFARAIRIAKAQGTERQILESRYEHIWSAFWWFDDVYFLQEHYPDFEKDVLATNHTITLEFLCNLNQLFVNCVIHGLLTREEAQLDERGDRIRAVLVLMAADKERPNNALEARTLLAVACINRIVLDDTPNALTEVWRDFSSIIDDAGGLAEFNASRLEKMVDLGGHMAGNDPDYTLLIEKLADFVSTRKSEGEGAIILLNRARKLDVEHSLDIVRLLGKATLRLTKKEYSGYLIEALYILSVAYQSAGLPWAARSAAIFAVSSAVIEGELAGEIPPTFASAAKLWALTAFSLGHLPDYLYAIQLLNGALVALPLDDASKEMLRDRAQELDFFLAGYFLNLKPADLDRLTVVPDLLAGLEMFTARTALLYINGHLPALRKDGSIPAAESDADVHALMSTMASQLVGQEHSKALILNEEGQQNLRTSVVGMNISLTHTTTVQSTIIAEMVLGSIEAFFGTALDQRVVPHTERLALVLEERSDIEAPSISVNKLDYEITLQWPQSVSPTSFPRQAVLQKFLLECAARIFELTCYTPDPEAIIRILFEDDAVQQRMMMVTATANSYHRVAVKFLSRLSDWPAPEQTYPPVLPRPVLNFMKLEGEPEPDKAEATDPSKPFRLKIESHHDVSVRSIIDIHAWDQARWKGVGYLSFEDRYPPVMMLLFENEEAAAKIFERWIERVGGKDSNNAIRVAVIRALPGCDKNHYRVMIYAQTLPSEDAPANKTSFIITSRVNTMQPTTDVNLNRFLREYDSYGCYFIAPAIISVSEQPWPIDKLKILKGHLNVKDASEIGDHDVERMALGRKAGQDD